MSAPTLGCTSQDTLELRLIVSVLPAVPPNTPVAPVLERTIFAPPCAPSWSRCPESGAKVAFRLAGSWKIYASFDALTPEKKLAPLSEEYSAPIDGPIWTHGVERRLKSIITPPANRWLPLNRIAPAVGVIARWSTPTLVPCSSGFTRVS